MVLANNMKKGFTLVEMLTVIVLLSLLVSIGIPSTRAIKKRIDERTYNSKVEIMETQIESWTQNNLSQYYDRFKYYYTNRGPNYYDIRAFMFINIGALDADEMDGDDPILRDPRDKTKCIHNYLYRITMKNNEVIDVKLISKPSTCEINHAELRQPV